MLYKELDLPSPLTKSAFEKLLTEKLTVIKTYTSVTTDINAHLTSDLKEIFKSLGVTPNAIVFFGHISKEAVYRKGFVHTDMLYDFKQKKYRLIPFAINWELTDETVTLQWWNTGDAKVITPTRIPETQLSLIYTNGQHFDYLNNKETNQYQLLDSYVMKKNQAVMINTCTPHSSNYISVNDYRVTVSIRFPLEQIPTWEHALTIFGR